MQPQYRIEAEDRRGKMDQDQSQGLDLVQE